MREHTVAKRLVEELRQYVGVWYYDDTLVARTRQDNEILTGERQVTAASYFGGLVQGSECLTFIGDWMAENAPDFIWEQDGEGNIGIFKRP